MIVQMTRTDTIADNLANVDTTAFKKDLSIFQSSKALDIYRMYDQKMPLSPVPLQTGTYIGKMGIGAQFVRNFTDFSQGSLKSTGNPLDLAMTGPDFFTVQTPAGILYTRDGSFKRDSNGTLMTVTGYPVMNTQNKPIVLGNGQITFDQNGNVFVNGQVVDQLKRVTLPQTLAIQKVGDNLFRYAGTPGPAQGEVKQGFLEASNANAIMEIVRLIEAQRAYEASSKALTSEDNALQLAVTNVGQSK